MSGTSLVHGRRATYTVLASLALVVGGCANSGETTTAASSGGNDATVAAPSTTATGETATTPAADGCTPATYGSKTTSLDGATIGFSQSEKEANPFRIAETQSMKDEAKKLGLKIETTNANSSLPKQISDIQDLVNKGVKLLIVAPLNSDGLDPAFAAAAAKGIPVITVDRKVNATFCKDFVTFIGSNFAEQGKRAADAMIKATGGKGQIAILLGSPGNNVTTDRTSGFVDQIKAAAPAMKIVAQQTGQFSRDEGQKVMEQLINSNPDITAVYAENDEMALGAVTALRAAGKKPGDDVKIVSIDGTRNAVQAIVDGTINAVIESNPRFGPIALKTATDFLGGTAIPENVIISDRQYDPSNAKADVASAY